MTSQLTRPSLRGGKSAVGLARGPRARTSAQQCRKGVAFTFFLNFLAPHAACTGPHRASPSAPDTDRPPPHSCLCATVSPFSSFGARACCFPLHFQKSTAQRRRCCASTHFAELRQQAHVMYNCSECTAVSNSARDITQSEGHSPRAAGKVMVRLTLFYPFLASEVHAEVCTQLPSWLRRKARSWLRGGRWPSSLLLSCEAASDVTLAGVCVASKLQVLLVIGEADSG